MLRRDDQPVAGGPGAFQKLDVPGVKQVETAVGETDLEAVGFPVRDDLRRAVAVDDLWVAVVSVVPQRRGQFARPHRRGAPFADRDASGRIADPGGGLDRGPGRQGQRKRRDDRVARAGNVEHLKRVGGKMGDRTFRIVRVIDGHPLRAAREHDGFDPRPLVEDLGGDLGVMVVHAVDARDHAGLGGVRRHHRRAGVARDVAGLGVDDYGNVARPRDFDDPPDEDRNEHAFGVVGQDDRRNLVDRLVQPAANRVDVVLTEMKAALDVEPHDLVAAGNVANLCRGRMAVRPNKPAHNSLALRQRTGD